MVITAAVLLNVMVGSCDQMTVIGGADRIVIAEVAGVVYNFFQMRKPITKVSTISTI
jgi:hypothetical protein